MNKQRGITLIALVVTIIVLIILASISINLILGENGIIKKAQDAKEATHISEEKEMLQLSVVAAHNYETGSIDENSLRRELTNYTGGTDKYILTKNGNKHEVVFTDCGRKYTITEDGKIKLLGKQGEEDIPPVIENPDKIVGLIALEPTELYAKGGDVYAITAGGEVKKTNRVEGNVFDKLVISNETVLKANGVKTIGDNYFIDYDGKLYMWENSLPICINDVEGSSLNGRKVLEVYDDNGTTIVKDNNGKIYKIASNNNLPVCLSDEQNSPLNGKVITKVYNRGYYLDNAGKLYTTESCINDLEGSALNGIRVVDLYFAGAIIAKDENGRIYTWGNNDYGQLGNGSTENSDVPICISNMEGNALKGKKIVDVYGTYDNCVIAKDFAGKIYTWGRNYEGELGDGTTEIGSECYRNEPLCISDIEGSALKGKNIVKFCKTFNDSTSSIIVKDDSGKLYGWGANYDAQLGVGYGGGGSGISTPVCINDWEESAIYGTKIEDIISVQSMGFSTIVMAKDINGKVYAWGNGIIYGCVNDIENSELKDVQIQKILYSDAWIDEITWIEDEEMEEGGYEDYRAFAYYAMYFITDNYICIEDYWEEQSG